MAYRINVKFKDGSANGFLATGIDQPPPRYGDTISVERYGHEVSARIFAVWTPSPKSPGSVLDASTVFEAREI